MKKRSLHVTLLLVALSFFTYSCQKEIPQLPGTSDERSAGKPEQGHLQQTNTYSSDVLLRWMDFQAKTLFKANAGPLGGPLGMRVTAYSGIAAYESVVPGMPAYQSLGGQLQDMPAMPKTMPGYAYHWPACMNAALAHVSKALFPAPDGQKEAQDKAIDDFSKSLIAGFISQGAGAELIDRSVSFGQSVAESIVAWANRDREGWPSDWQMFPNLNPPIGTEADFDKNSGKWVRTSSANAALPYWSHTRLLVSGSLNGIRLNKPAELEYSTEQGSAFRTQAENLLNNSYNPHNLSINERRIIAKYYRDFPGYGTGHYLSIVKQVLAKAEPSLDIGVLTFAKMGIAGQETTVGLFKVKYLNNNLVVRPQTYIRKVLGHETWSAPFYGTPNHPEYPSAHSGIAGAVAEVLTRQFGNNFSFTDASYQNFPGMDEELGSRHYHSFWHMADEIGDSRVYGQIHYPRSCQDGKALGRKVAQNILSTINFLK